MKKVVVYLSVWFILCAGLAGFAIFIYMEANKPQPTGTTNEKIYTMQDPMQAPYSGNQVFLVGDENQFHVVPIATYKIWGVVIGKKEYRHEFTPMDLCIVWGKLAEPENLLYFHASMGKIAGTMGRGCQPRWDRELSLEYSYILTHLSNNHIIPANDNILKALQSIKTGQRIYLEGYLVKIYEKGYLRWESSMSRMDIMCETIYVMKVQIDNKIYT